MRLLLDSHVVLWLLFLPGKVPPETMAVLEDCGNGLWVSVASLWEMKLKSAVGKLSLPEGFYRAIDEAGMTFLPITPTHIDKATQLPLHHKDPFDRMLIAQALVEDMTLVSADRKAAFYDVPLLWS